MQTNSANQSLHNVIAQSLAVRLLGEFCERRADTRHSLFCPVQPSVWHSSYDSSMAFFFLCYKMRRSTPSLGGHIPLHKTLQLIFFFHKKKCLVTIPGPAACCLGLPLFLHGLLDFLFTVTIIPGVPDPVPTRDRDDCRVPFGHQITRGIVRAESRHQTLLVLSCAAICVAFLLCLG